jgi:hypothetical protein
MSSVVKLLTGASISDLIVGADSTPLETPATAAAKRDRENMEFQKRSEEQRIKDTPSIAAARSRVPVSTMNDLASIGLFVGGRGRDGASTLQEQLVVLRDQLQEQRQLNANFQTNFGN